MTRLEKVMEENNEREMELYKYKYSLNTEISYLHCCAGYLKNISESLAMLVDLERERKE